jgi:hypothetical protein
MRVAFLASDKAREQLLADALLMGARKHGHETSVHDLTDKETALPVDVACMCGVKSRELFNLYRQQGTVVVYLDKGYVRSKRVDAKGWEYWRFSVNTHQPTRRLEVLDMPADRLDQLGLQLRPWRKSGRQIVFAGSSQKYHDFLGLRDATGYAKRIVRELNTIVDRPVIYRPKPSWADARAVPGAKMSPPEASIDTLLVNAWALVTHGSSACFEAQLAGIPSVILGDAIARPISSTELRDVRAPLLADDKARRRWLANVAYFQWTLSEMASGAAWEFIGEEIHA